MCKFKEGGGYEGVCSDNQDALEVLGQGIFKVIFQGIRSW